MISSGIRQSCMAGSEVNSRTGCEGVTMVFDNGSDESLNYYWIVDEMDSLFDISNDLVYNFGDRVYVALYVENSNGCLLYTSPSPRDP